MYSYIRDTTLVTNKKLLGTNYGAMFVPTILNLSIEAPRVGLTQGTGFGAGDTYIQPINLGWTTKHADVIAWYGLFAPTGKFVAGGEGNRGLGMWSHELDLGSTLVKTRVFTPSHWAPTSCIQRRKIRIFEWVRYSPSKAVSFVYQRLPCSIQFMEVFATRKLHRGKRLLSTLKGQWSIQNSRPVSHPLYIRMGYI
jgi:hypothetical protein